MNEWKVPDGAKPFQWAIVVNGNVCPWRKGHSCSCDTEHLNPSGKCSYENCPVKVDEVFPEKSQNMNNSEEK
ncbi:hypothetical protein [Pseudodesulfovibrio sediminis]|uniref:Uncharacterized protein n=1 Tax=Pseudodesulfovibrio sediminis TaxID=2810563 RepID=A0ABN6EQD5_9BACT|nr:hypothetical protein [Pseudodesulfovibrio sediminis]BCS87366.1 hypothetical protein PSDVSF_06080 [Pseudodesulfovibrio sediminis]